MYLNVNIVKSIIVVVLFVCLGALCLFMLCKCVECYRKRALKLLRCLGTLCFFIVFLFSLVCCGEYAYPFDRKVDPILIAEFEVPEGYELEYPGQKFWHGAYEQFGLYAESFYFDPEEQNSVYGFGWPPMDFDSFCYIITYGQEIESLSYNVWETIDIPIRTGAKVGHMRLKEEFHAERVYIYQIPKVRIENDINDIDRPWD